MLKYFRYSLAGLIILIYSIIASIVAAIFWKNQKVNNYVAPIFGKTVQFVMGIKNVFKNPDMLYQKRPCIYISNHQSNIDAWTITANHPGDTITLGKMEIVFIPFFGLLYYLLGHILINRKNKMGSVETLNNLSKQLLQRKLSIWILPEGTRSKGKGLMPFKKGPFHLAINSGLPIVPVAISSYHKNLNFNKLRSGTVLFKTLPLIETKGLTSDDVSSLAKKCHDLLKVEIEKLDEEIKLSGE